MAQLTPVAMLAGFVFTRGFIFAFVVGLLVGQRISSTSECEGLGLPEMGALTHPESELKSRRSRAQTNGQRKYRNPNQAGRSRSAFVAEALAHLAPDLAPTLSPPLSAQFGLFTLPAKS